MSESDIEDQILHYLNLKLRFVAWKNSTSGFFDTRRGVFRKQVSKFARNGVSDVIVLLPEKTAFIEVKTPEKYRYIQKHWNELKSYFGENKDKNRLKEQIQFIEEVNASGNIGFFACSIECVENELKNRGVIC